MRALRIRMLQCRSGYVVSFDENVKHWIVRFANGSVANGGELADFVLAPYVSLLAVNLGRSHDSKKAI